MERLDADESVYVIDLRAPSLEETRRSVTTAAEPGAGELPGRLPPAPDEPVRRVALLVDGLGEPLLLPIEPTTDAALLDALGRLLRLAAVAGERVPFVATEYGGEHERRLAFERRLPAWTYRGLPREAARRLPPRLRRVLGPLPG